MTQKQDHFDKNEAKKFLVDWASRELNIHKASIVQLINTGLSGIERFEATARNLRLVDETVEILSEKSSVWVLSGPSLYSFKYTQETCENWARYESHPLVKNQKGMFKWIQNMEPQRVDTSVDLIRKATGRVVGVDISCVTREHIKEFGPRLIYNGMKIQNEAVHSSVITNDAILPEEKVHLFHEYGNENGQPSEIKNTRDQVVSFHLPENIESNNLVVVAHGAQISRFAHLLQHYSEVIPEGITVYGFPLPTPMEYLKNYAQMEMMGIIEGCYKHKNMSDQPFPIRLATEH